MFSSVEKGLENLSSPTRPGRRLWSLTRLKNKNRTAPELPHFWFYPTLVKVEHNRRSPIHTRSVKGKDRFPNIFVDVAYKRVSLEVWGERKALLARTPIHCDRRIFRLCSAILERY